MLVNGSAQHSLPLSDRAIHYGDGAFETVLVDTGVLTYWPQHLQRLENACKLLHIPFDAEVLEREVRSLIVDAKDSGIIKIIVSRGSGGRGYAPPRTANPTRIVQRHPIPADYAQFTKTGIRTMLCRHPISENVALAGVKHLNRLDQILASLELHEGFQEGLLCNARGYLIEGIKSNVFLIKDGALKTPLLDTAGVAGILRDVILEHCRDHSWPIQICAIPFDEILDSDEVFLCNSVFGIWPVTEVFSGERTQHFSVGQLTRALQNALQSGN